MALLQARELEGERARKREASARKASGTMGSMVFKSMKTGEQYS